MTNDVLQTFRRRSAAIVSICAVLSVVHIIPAHAELQMKDPAPSFLTHTNTSFTQRHPQTAITQGLGLIPSPVDLSHLRGKQLRTPSAATVRAALLPQYDLRTSTAAIVRLTPVRDQGSHNTSWAFAALASLESTLMPLETRDFSENNMVNRSGYDLEYEEGGTMLMAAAYLLRWDGPVNEADDPYANPGNSPAGLTPQKCILDVLFIPGRNDPSDNDNIKQAIIDYGPVMTDMYIDTGTYLNTGKDAYYFNGARSSNHAVAIVGWDDTYSKSNFSVAPSSDGAFIVRNSWGTSFGEDGYFYVSYYDNNIGNGTESNAVFSGNQNLSNNIIYQHDTLGMTAYMLYMAQPDTAWGANVFTASNNEVVRAVGFYTLDVNTSYEISVYDELKNKELTGLRAQQTGVIDAPGYHTVELDTPVSVARGHTFCVAVKLSVTTGAARLAVETPTSICTPFAAAGQSFTSEDGATWEDVTVDYANTNVCLKAYAGWQTVEDNTTLSLARAFPNPINFSKAVNGTLKFENLTDSARVKIFDITGRLVKSLDPATPGISDNSATAAWDGTNESGAPVAMGIYLYLVTDRAGNTARGKVVVLK